MQDDLSGAAGLIGATGVSSREDGSDHDRGETGETGEGERGGSDAPGGPGGAGSIEPTPDAGEPTAGPAAADVGIGEADAETDDERITEGPAATPVLDPAGAASVTPAAPGERDNLKLIRGIGPRNEGRLNDIGVFRFAQIAAWTRRQQREIGEELAFPGRIEREGWVTQAKRLAAGGAKARSRRADVGPARTGATAAGDGEHGSRPPGLEAPRDGKPDNLTLINGVGNVIERKLFKLGIYHFDQVAAWSEEEAVWIGQHVGFPGRAERENWREEARVLGEGGTTERADRVERGQIKTSRQSGGEEA